MREGGLKAISCTSRVRVANAYFRWAGLPLHIGRLKEEETVLPTLTAEQVGKLVCHKPNTPLRPSAPYTCFDTTGHRPAN